MYERKLFLGLRVDADFALALSAVEAKRLHHFLKGSQDCLQEIYYLNDRFLGKEIHCPTDLASLELLELNVYSLLKQLLPHYSYIKAPLWLFPYVNIATASIEGSAVGR